jgi:uncharacterized protein
MKLTHHATVYALALFALSACVTVNITFPPAAAQQAADQIIDQVWQKDAEDPAEDPPVSDKQSGLWQNFGIGLLNIVIPAAQAAPNFNISSPAISAIQDRMAKRHKDLESHYDNGAIGLTNDGFIALRDVNSVALSLRNRVKTWVSDENNDRDMLYTEIAKANGQPDWKKDIQKTFAERWISRAKKGWWYQNKQGAWVQK